MVVSLHMVVGNWILGPLLALVNPTHSGGPHSLRPKYTVAVFRHTRRGRQISLWVVVSHHVVAGIWTQDDLQKSSQCSYLLSHLSSPFFFFFFFLKISSLYITLAALDLLASSSLVHHHTWHLNCLFYLFWMCIWGMQNGAQAMVCVWRSEFSPTMWVPGLRLWSSGSAASVFAHWSIYLASLDIWKSVH